jgi:predicted dehydrogenase
MVKYLDVKIVAMCDIKEQNLKNGLDLVEKITQSRPSAYLGDEYHYRKLLERDDLDAVLIASPVEWHVRMSIDAMKAGKDVGCEVTAGDSVEELWELVKTKEGTGKHYMMLENYNYGQGIMMVQNMIQQGIFGEPYYAECGYIHDCKHLCFNSDGSLTWRGERQRDNYGHPYATHSLGPVSKWFGINDGDRMQYMTSMMTEPRMLHLYAVEKFGPDSPAAQVEFKHGDHYTSKIHTVGGKVICVDFDMVSYRPVNYYYLMQGTKGVYSKRSRIIEGIYLKGDKDKYRYTNISEYRNKYEHPCWKKFASVARNTGHSGGDYFVLRDFVDMVRQDKEPWIDVYDAATWSCITHLSRLSLDNNSQSIEMPDFTQGKWKDKNWRKSRTQAC